MPLERDAGDYRRTTLFNRRIRGGTHDEMDIRPHSANPLIKPDPKAPTDAGRRAIEPLAAESPADESSRPAAGGGRVGRPAESAAWMPGGRRHVPGSKAFLSHFGHGLKVTRDEAGRPYDQASPEGHRNETVHPLIGKERGPARRRHVRPPTREALTLTDVPDPSRAPTGPPQESRGCLLMHRRSPFDSASLLQVARDEGLDERYGDDAGGVDRQHPAGASAKSVDAEVYDASGLHPNNFDGETGSSGQVERTRGQVSSTPPVEMEGGTTLTEEGSRSGGSQYSVARSKYVSDTYKSSLVFG